MTKIANNINWKAIYIMLAKGMNDRYENVFRNF